MLYTAAVLTAVAAYLVGSINPSIILSKAIYGRDIRDSGSGNAGTTNMLRTYGKGLALATLVCDILKGALMVAIAMWIDNLLDLFAGNAALSFFEKNFLLGNLKYIAGLFAVIGHDFPIYFGFRGGKGVATSLGTVLMLNWQVGLIVLAAAIIVMAVSRYVSLGSVTAGGIYPFVLFTYFLAKGENTENILTALVTALLLAVLLIGKHHSNIARLKNGTESKLFSKKSEAAETEEEME